MRHLGVNAGKGADLLCGMGIVHFIEGKAILTMRKARSGPKKGDGFIIPAGFKGTWETVKKLHKHYVILMPKGI